MADKISALIFSALASDAEKPRASKMFPFTIWAGLFSAALFMCPLLLQSLLHSFLLLRPRLLLRPIETFVQRTWLGPAESKRSGGIDQIHRQYNSEKRSNYAKHGNDCASRLELICVEP